MANVSHASLSGSNLHEPKGIGTATSGQAYIATGGGTGVWTDISSSSFVGMVADFTTPIAPAGWLELNGTDISTSTFSALYNAMTIQQTGTRGSGSKIISGLSSTTNMRPGYYVYGLVAGQIVSGSVIATVDSSTQITMDTNASSGGTATVVVSPWLLNTGTIRLPDVSSAARYRRARSSSLHMGVAQAQLLNNHTHTGTGTSGTESAGHTHLVSGSTGGQNTDHTHTIATGNTPFTGGATGLVAHATSADGTMNTGGFSVDHVHGISITSGNTSANHTHVTTITTGNPDGGLGGGETRPVTLVFMTCVKT